MNNVDAEKQKVIFSANLNRYMARSGEKTADLANALGYPFSTVSDWVKGKKYPRMDKVQILADHFGILKSDLTEEKPTPVSESGPSDPIIAQIMDVVCQMMPEERRLYLENLKTLRLLQEQGRKPDIQE